MAAFPDAVGKHYRLGRRRGTPALTTPACAGRIMGHPPVPPESIMTLLPRAAIVLLAANLAGCYTPEWYRPPAGDTVATLTIRNASTVAAYPQTFRNPDDCSGGKLLLASTQALDPGATTTVRVAPDRAFPFFITAHTLQGDCHVAGRFRPRAGASYLAEWSIDGSTCGLAMAVRNGAVVVEEPTFERLPWNTAFSEKGAFCN
jgi:hypothetical protein